MKSFGKRLLKNLVIASLIVICATAFTTIFTGLTMWLTSFLMTMTGISEPLVAGLVIGVEAIILMAVIVTILGE